MEVVGFEKVSYGVHGSLDFVGNVVGSGKVLGGMYMHQSGVSTTVTKVGSQRGMMLWCIVELSFFTGDNRPDTSVTLIIDCS